MKRWKNVRVNLGARPQGSPFYRIRCMNRASDLLVHRMNQASDYVVHLNRASEFLVHLNSSQPPLVHKRQTMI